MQKVLGVVLLRNTFGTFCVSLAVFCYRVGNAGAYILAVVHRSRGNQEEKLQRVQNRFLERRREEGTFGGSRRRGVEEEEWVTIVSTPPPWSLSA